MYKKISIAIILVSTLAFFLFIFNDNQEYVFEQMNNITRGSITEYSLEEANLYSCTIIEPENRTIILRLDDITAWNDLDLMERMTEDILSRKYGVNLAVIPHGIGADRDLVRWLQKIKENPEIELSQHGYDHSEEEFVNLNYEDATKKINLGKDIMVRLFGQIPINFIPPYNVNSKETMSALKDAGFKTFSGNKNEYNINSDFVKAGYTTTTYYYSQDRFVYSGEVLGSCKTTLDEGEVCAIMMHPQDFTTDGKIDEDKYAEYIKVLDGLKNLNAQVVNFRQAFCKEY